MSAASFLPKASPMDIDNEDSLDAPPSVGSSDATPSTPAQKKVCRSSTTVHFSSLHYQILQLIFR